MLTCSQARLLIDYGAMPGTPRKGLPELGFHLATCAACRTLWDHVQAARSFGLATPLDEDTPLPPDDVPGISLTSFRPIDATLISTESFESWEDLVMSRDPAGVPQPVTSPDPEMPVTYRALLRNRNFRRIWLGESISTFGTYFTRIAVPIYVFSLTNSFTYLGLAAFSSLVASLVFGLFAGALADRWNRRRTMIGADVVNGLLLIGLLVLALLPLPLAVELGGIFVVNFCAGMLRELFTPSRIALMAEVLDEHELLTANSLDQATTTLCELLSYPVAAAALLYFGPALAFGVDAASFFVSALLLLGVQSSYVAPEDSASTSILREIGAGLRIANGLPLVRELVLLSLIIPLNLSLLNTLQLPFAVEVLGSSEELGFPALEGAMALGVVLGMLALGRWGQRVERARLLAYGICSIGVTVLSLGLLPQIVQLVGLGAIAHSRPPWTPLLLLALPLLLLAGASNSLILASIRTVLQENTPRPALGRVASVVGVAAGLGFALGALLAAGLGLILKAPGLATGGQSRIPLIMTLIGVLLCLIGLLCRWWLLRDRFSGDAESAVVASVSA